MDKHCIIWKKIVHPSTLFLLVFSFSAKMWLLREDLNLQPLILKSTLYQLSYATSFNNENKNKTLRRNKHHCSNTTYLSHNAFSFVFLVDAFAKNVSHWSYSNLSQFQWVAIFYLIFEIMWYCCSHMSQLQNLWS